MDFKKVSKSKAYELLGYVYDIMEETIEFNTTNETLMKCLANAYNKYIADKGLTQQHPILDLNDRETAIALLSPDKGNLPPEEYVTLCNNGTHCVRTSDNRHIPLVGIGIVGHIKNNDDMDLEDLCLHAFKNCTASYDYLRLVELALLSNFEDI